MLWCCWLGGRKGIRPLIQCLILVQCILFACLNDITEWWGAGVVICLEWGADLHMFQLMSLPLTVSCFSKIQIGFAFLVPAHLGSPGKRAVKPVWCVCVSMQWINIYVIGTASLPQESDSGWRKDKARLQDGVSAFELSRVLWHCLMTGRAFAHNPPAPVITHRFWNKCLGGTSFPEKWPWKWPQWKLVTSKGCSSVIGLMLLWKLLLLELKVSCMLECCRLRTTRSICRWWTQFWAQMATISQQRLIWHIPCSDLPTPVQTSNICLSMNGYLCHVSLHTLQCSGKSIRCKTVFWFLEHVTGGLQCLLINSMLIYIHLMWLQFWNKFCSSMSMFRV